MAVLSPGTVVSLITLFFINRIGQKMLVYENIFLIGLKYCLEPTPADLSSAAAHANASLPTASAAAAPSSKKPSKTKPKPKTKTQKPSREDLPVVRNGLGPNLFVGEPVLPKCAEFETLLGMASSFVVAYAVEEAVMCAVPGATDAFGVSQTHWFGALIFIVSTYEMLSLTVLLASGALTACLVAVGAVVALGAIANGDGIFRFAAAFAALGAWARSVHVVKLGLGDSSGGGDADFYAGLVVAIAKVATGVVAGVLFASTAVPARRFAALDFDLYRRYRRDEDAERDDVYALPKPRHWLMLALGVDHFLALAVLLAAAGRTGDGTGDARLAVGFAAVVALRLLLVRTRLQSYLDGAITHFRNFWVEERSSKDGEVEAGSRLRTNVVLTYYYICQIGCLVTFGPVVGLMLAMIAKRSGGLDLGVTCKFVVGDLFERKPAPEVAPVSVEVWARETFLFLACVYFASYAFFSMMSFVIDAIFEWAQKPSLQAIEVPSGAPMSSSMRRKARRAGEEEQRLRDARRAEMTK